MPAEKKCADCGLSHWGDQPLPIGKDGLCANCRQVYLAVARRAVVRVVDILARGLHAKGVQMPEGLGEAEWREMLVEILRAHGVL